MLHLARQPDPVHVLHALGVPDLPDHPVHLLLEGLDGLEVVHPHRHDHVPAVVPGAEILVEVDDVPAEGSAVQHAGQQADDHVQAVPLVASDRQEESFRGALGVGEGLPLPVDHPADRDRLSLLGRQLHLAVGGHRRRDVQDDGGLVAGRNGEGDRVRAEDQLDAAPGAMWLALATVMYMPTMSWASGIVE